jgi:hypothetical protein
MNLNISKENFKQIQLYIVSIQEGNAMFITSSQFSKKPILSRIKIFNTLTRMETFNLNQH